MSGMDYLRQGGTPFDVFLYAEVGHDVNGNSVSVLSLLARLGVDPWVEAADLSGLSRAGAQMRLKGLMARVGDVPELGGDAGPVVARLVDLLPQPPRQFLGAAPTGNNNRAAAPAWPPTLAQLGPIVAAIIVILFLVRTFIFGAGGTGE